MATRRAREAAEIWRSAARLAADLDDELTLASIRSSRLKEIRELVGADGIALHLRDGERLLLLRDLGFPAAFGNYAAALPLDESNLIAKAAIRPDARIVRDVRAEIDARERDHFRGLSSLLIAPLEARQQLAGVLTLGFQQPDAVDSVDQSLIAFLAHGLAVAMLDVRSRENEQRLSETFQAIDEASLAIAMEHEPRGVLQAILERARAVVGARYAALGIGKDPTRQFDPWLFSGIDAKRAALIGRHPRAVGMLGAVPAEGRILRVADLDADPRFGGWPAHHPKMTSFLGVPILLRGEPIGNLYLTDKIGAAEFGAEDERAAALLAAHAGIAYRHAQLFEQAQSERNRLQALVEYSPLGIIFVERDGDYVYLNRAAEQLFGRAMSPREGRSQYIGQFYLPDGQPAPEESLPSSRALRGEQVIGMELVVRRHDNREVSVLANAAPIRDAQGNVIAAVVLWQDITPLKLERLREEFISVVAHELRTPITVISGYADLVRREADEKTRKPVEAIKVSVQRLERMVSDLLDASRLEAHRLALEVRPVQLEQVTRELVERVGSLLGEHPVDIEIADRLPRVIADPGRVEQVITNLLVNAAKYSPRGSHIRVTVRSGYSEVIVAVSNEGPGIAEADLRRLFTRFFRSQTARESGTPGIGIGLYLARGLIEAQGGRIWASSEPNKETVFAFALPAAA